MESLDKQASFKASHPNSPPRKDFEDPSFFSASATKSMAFFSLSDMMDDVKDDKLKWVRNKSREVRYQNAVQTTDSTEQ